MRSIILVILFSTAQLFGATGELPTSVGTPLEAANDTQLTTELGNATAGQHILLTGSSYSTHRTLADGIMIIGDPASAPDINGISITTRARSLFRVIGRMSKDVIFQTLPIALRFGCKMVMM